MSPPSETRAPKSLLPLLSQSLTLSSSFSKALSSDGTAPLGTGTLLLSQAVTHFFSTTTLDSS